MSQHRTHAIRIFVAALLFAVVGPAPAAAAATVNTVVQWNEYATTSLIAAAPTGAGQTPPVATPHLAMVHGAVYDAVNAIDGEYRPYLAAPPAQPWYSKDAAAATAAYRVLIDPSLRVPEARKLVLAGLYAASLAGIPDGPAKDGGVAVGVAAAATMLTARLNDGRFGTFRFTVPTEPAAGQWRPSLPAFISDPNAWVARVTPFLVRSRDQFRSSGPNALTSHEYAVDFAEVKEVGALNSATRTADQTDAARFWTDHATAMWSRIFRGLSTTRGLTTTQNARFFAMLYLTGADSLITCWADKAYWLFWRPISAIREAASDGNPATIADPTWLPLVNTPPYPDHSSGHSCLSSSYVETLHDFFGTDKIAFSDQSAVTGTTRSFAHFSDAINEIVNARVWEGLHFRAADIAGAMIGKRVAQWRHSHYFHKSGSNNENDSDNNEQGSDNQH